MFFELLKYSPAPRVDLQRLGLNPDLEKYTGTNIFSADIPVEDPEFEAAFFDRIGAAKLAPFYLGHPSRLAGVFKGLRKSAFSLRPSYLGNFEKSYGLRAAGAKPGVPALEQAEGIRGAPGRRGFWPFSLGECRRGAACVYEAGSHHLKAVMVLLLVLVLMALEQLLVAAVAGQYELVKHLFLFNLLFDLCLCADVRSRDRLAQLTPFSPRLP